MYKVSYKVTPNVWHADYYNTEKEAREFANLAFLTGAYAVEVYKKLRGSYILIDSAKQTMKQAAKRCGEYMAEGF